MIGAAIYVILVILSVVFMEWTYRRNRNRRIICATIQHAKVRE